MRGYRTGRSSDFFATLRLGENLFHAKAPSPQRRRNLNDTLMVIQFHHVNVTVPPELETVTKEFYGSVLGLQQVPKPAASRQSGAWYQIGATQLHLSVEDEPISSLSSRHVCFMVDNLDAIEKRFRDAGVEIIPEPRPVPGTPRFYVRDPGGNQLEIVQASV